jgi:uncharacterized protein (TIGR02271 family)
MPLSSPSSAPSSDAASHASSPDASQTLPLIEEQVSVARERVNTGAVRVRVEEHRQPVPVALSAFSDAVQVERVRVEREVGAVEPPWHDGDVLVVPVYEERIVVQRRLVLTEELRIRRERRQQQWHETVELRRDEARVERRDADGDWHADDARGGPSTQADPRAR